MHVSSSIPQIGYNTPNKQEIFHEKIKMLRNYLIEENKKGLKFETLIRDAYKTIQSQKSTNFFNQGVHTKKALKAITKEVLNISDKETLSLETKKKILKNLASLKNEYPNAFDNRLDTELTLKIEQNKNNLIEQEKINHQAAEERSPIAKRASLVQISRAAIIEQTNSLERNLAIRSLAIGSDEQLKSLALRLLNLQKKKS